MVFPGRVIHDSKLGDDWLPIIPVLLRHGDTELQTRMLVDSGSHITLLPFTIGLVLGLEVGDDEPVVGQAIGGGAIAYKLRSISISIGPHGLRVRTAWLFDDESSLLLGRLDVFDAFNFEFRQAERKLIVTPS